MILWNNKSYFRNRVFGMKQFYILSWDQYLSYFMQIYFENNTLSGVQLNTPRVCTNTLRLCTCQTAAFRLCTYLSSFTVIMTDT